MNKTDADGFAGRIQTSGRDWIRLAADAAGGERLEAFFTGRAYRPHRHDTYAIGQTLAGVQSFRYRGTERHSLPGGTLVLHPDELHDGHAGTVAGFRDRIAYVEPAAIQAVLGGRALPFIDGGISRSPQLFAAGRALLRGIDEPIEALDYDDTLYDLAHALEAAAGGSGRRPRIADHRAAERARDFLRADPARAVTMAELERVSGRNRWSLSRDFRLLYGTSPYRYLVMRRLEAVKGALRAGVPPAEAALGAGFSDQSHMTRHFTRAFGIPPARWLSIISG